jgi:CRISPR/Cas system CSM-associated protein Csm3 (group 7 of RAMP superfamily)
LTGTLVAQSPLHVGGHGDDVDTDLPLARDGAGQLYVPGTSLAGAFRQWCELAFDNPDGVYEQGDQPTEQVWGYQDRRPDSVNLSRASFVVIDDAVIENAETVVVEIRDGVGIDRQWGAAAEHIKYDRAILPRGTRMKLNLGVDATRLESRAEILGMMAALKAALEQGEVRLGAAKTRGLGQVRLTDGTLIEQVFGTRQGILGLLRQSAGAIVSSRDIDQASAAHRPQPRPRLTLKVHWKPDGPLMVKAGFDGIAADILPLTSGIDGQVSLVLPGSSVKGAFRSQAERIVRTVLQESPPAWLGEQDAKKKFLDAVEVELINELFGKRGKKDDPNAGLGAVAVIDCQWIGQKRLEATA